MMNEKVKTMIRLFWQDMLRKEDRRKLLSELTEREGELRRDMADEFDTTPDDEQLHREEDYQLYLRQVLEKTGYVDSTKRRTWPRRYRWGLAASLLMIAGFGHLTWQHITTDAVVAVQQVARQTTVYADDSVQMKVLTLNDGSEVRLYPGSSLTYDTDYGEVNRSLKLIGEAQFTVSRDTTRPFIVEAKGYTTTALGTSFIVDARQKDRVHVRLLTGKVVVKSKPQTPYAIADQYLLPGEELAIQVDRLLLDKRSFVEEPQAPTLGDVAKPSPPKKNTSVTVDLHFEETPLPEVLNRIAKARQIRIDLVDVDLQERYFTGDFSEKDDAEMMLNIISTINNLEYEKQDANSVKFRHVGGKKEKQNNKLD